MSIVLAFHVCKSLSFGLIRAFISFCLRAPCIEDLCERDSGYIGQHERVFVKGRERERDELIWTSFIPISVKSAFSKIRVNSNLGKRHACRHPLLQLKVGSILTFAVCKTCLRRCRFDCRTHLLVKVVVIGGSNYLI